MRASVWCLETWKSFSNLLTWIGRNQSRTSQCAGLFCGTCPTHRECNTCKKLQKPQQRAAIFHDTLTNMSAALCACNTFFFFFLLEWIWKHTFLTAVQLHFSVVTRCITQRGSSLPLLICCPAFTVTSKPASVLFAAFQGLAYRNAPSIRINELSLNSNSHPSLIHV